jgi:hypothetical protein
MGEEFGREDAVEILVETGESLESLNEESDRSVQDMVFNVQQFEPGPSLFNEVLWENSVAYDEEEVDDLITDLYSAITSWAEMGNQPYGVSGRDYYDGRVDEDLVKALEGYVETESGGIGFEFKGQPHVYADGAAQHVEARYKGLDASMENELKELHSITSGVAEEHGRVSSYWGPTLSD